MEIQAHRVLHGYGDKELWHAEAEDGSWRLPMMVEWKHDKESDEHFGHVQPAVCLFHAQALAMVAMLQVHDIQGRMDNWVIPRRMVEALLHKATGVTPRFYYMWPGDDGPPMEPKPPLQTDFDHHHRPGSKVNKPRTPSFVEWLAKETKISSSIINAVLNAVADGAPRWLVEYRRPLDLGFCRLIAVPFRANWKEIVAFKAKAQNLKLRTLFNLPADRLWTALEDAGLPEILTSPHNVGLRRGWQNEDDVARIDYTLETIPSEQFESAVNRIEGKRMSRGPAAYVAEFEDAVEAVYQSAVSALRSYLKKIAMPFAAVCGRSGSGSIGFTPVLGGRKVEVRGTPLCSLPVRVVESGSRFSVFGKKSDQFLIPETTHDVPQVPAILQAPVDVRERTVDGHLELIDGTGADRLPVPNEFEKFNAGEPVLPCSKDSGDGLASDIMASLI